MNNLEGRRATVSMTLAAASPPAPSAAPQAEVYRERVAHLQEALRRNPNGPEAPEVVRGLIEHVDLPPARSVRGLEFGISGGIAAMPRLGLGAAGKPSRLSRTRLTGVDPALSESPVNLVAGAGFEPAAFRL